MNESCFECGATDGLQQHHVVPRSRGGTKTVPLCGECHGKAHHRDKNMASPELTKAALAAKRERGERTGHIPFGFTVADGGQVLIKDEEEQRVIAIVDALRADGASWRTVASELNDRGISNRPGRAWNHTNVRLCCTRAE